MRVFEICAAANFQIEVLWAVFEFLGTSITVGTGLLRMKALVNWVHDCGLYVRKLTGSKA